MTIHLRVPGVLLLVGLGAAASVSPGAAQTIASGANQTFGVGQAPTAMSPITVTDASKPTIQQAKDIRIRIPLTFNMTWNTALTTATITGSGATKVSTTVSYEDGGHTLVLDVTTNFAANDQITVSGLQYANFTATSSGTHLQLVVAGSGGATAASDSKTVQIVAATISSAANQTFVTGQAPTAISAITVTDASAPLITAANDIRIRIPASFNMTWNTALTTATISGKSAAKVSPTVSYEDGGKTLVVNVTTNFAGGDQIVVSGLQYQSFTAPSGVDNLELVVAGSGGGTNDLDAKTILIAAPTIASAANQLFFVGQAATAISPITITDAATPTITTAKDIRVRIPASFNMTWNTGLTTATITGGAASKVSTTVSYEDGGKTLVLSATSNFGANDQIIVSGLAYVGFTAPSGPDYLQLVVTGAGGGTSASDGRTIQVATPPAMASGASQSFVVGQAATAISPITVTESATPSITAANDIRVRIPGTLNMSWNTALTTATITGSGAAKVAPTVSYEDGGKTVVLNVTANFAGNDQIVVSGLQYTSFTAPSPSDYLQLVVTGSGGSTVALDSRTIQVVQPAIASAANQVFAVGQGATATAAITVTDAATPSITAARDIRIRIPGTLSTTWNTALTTATLTGTGASKLSTTVSYEDGGKTLVLNVTADFAGNDQIVVSGLQYLGFTAPSAAAYLQLVVTGPGGGTNASDSRTIQIVQPTIASAADQLFLVGQAATTTAAITVTDAATPSITAAQDIRVRIPATLNMTWNTALTTATLTGTGASKVSTTVSYEDGGKTLVLNVTTNFAGSDQVVISGLQYKSFTAASTPDHLQLVVTGPGGGTNASDSRAIQIVAPTIASAADQLFLVGQAATAIAAITITDATTPTITTAKGIRIRIPSTFNMTWNTALTAASVTGNASSKVSKTVSYEDGGKTLVISVTANFAAGDRIVVSGLQYTSFTAASAPDYLQLVVSGSGAGTSASDSHTIQIVAPTIASAANQVFVIGQPPAASSPITVTDASTPTITAANDIRIRIPSSFNMTWNTALTTATITGSGAGKVSTTVSYEDGGKTLVLNVTTNFAANDQIVVSGLQYMSFTAPSASDYLQLVIAGSGGSTVARDSRTITIVQPTIASAANQVFVGGQAPTAISPITVTDAAPASITAANDIRIRIPSSFNMTWNTALTTATITGSGAGKVATTVSYEDGGKTLVLNVTSNFAGNDQIVVSGLQYSNFTGLSAPDYLQLVVFGSGGNTAALDSRTIQIVAPTISSSRNNIYELGEGPTATSPITVTDAASPTITAGKDIRIHIPATLNMSWDVGRTTATLAGGAAGKVSTTVSYEDGGKTLVLNVTSDFAASDQIIVSGLRFVNFAALSPPDRLQLLIGGAGANPAGRDDKTIVIATPTVFTGVFKWAVFGDVGISMGGGLSDSYDSRVAPYNPATARSNGDLASNIDITLSSSTIVKGDVMAVGNAYNTDGVQGNVITDAARIPQDPNLTCPTVAYSNDLGRLPHGVTYDPSTGALVVDGGGNLTLTGIFYYFSSITLTGGGTITFDNGGRHADIWVSTDLKLSGGSIVNTATLPTGLEIWACGNPPAPSGWTLSGASSNVYMSLYAPNHDLTVNGSGDVFGAFIVKTFSSQGGARVHFDEALGFVSGPIYYGNPYGASVSPHTATARQLPSNGTNYPVVFTLLNTGSSNTTDNFDLFTKRRPGTVLSAVSITGSGVTQGSNPDSARLANLADGASAAVTVTYAVGNVPVGTTDTLVFAARSVGGPTNSDSGVVTVTVVRPSLTIGRAVSPNGSLAPGTVLNYALTITNSGTSNAAAVALVDTLAPAVQLKVGSVAATLPAGVSAVLQYSKDGGTTWTYVPASAACGAPAGYDRCVNRIRWQLQNPLSYSAPDNSGSLQFVAQIR